MRGIDEPCNVEALDGHLAAKPENSTVTEVRPVPGALFASSDKLDGHPRLDERRV